MLSNLKRAYEVVVVRRIAANQKIDSLCTYRYSHWCSNTRLCTTRLFENTLSNGAWWTVPIATIVAVPLYSNAVGVIPIMQALVIKGVPIGTALVFMMATVGLSLPEALILKKVMSLKLLAMYFGVVTTGIIIIGWIINFLF